MSATLVDMGAHDRHTTPEMAQRPIPEGEHGWPVGPAGGSAAGHPGQ